MKTIQCKSCNTSLVAVGAEDSKARADNSLCMDCLKTQKVVPAEKFMIEFTRSVNLSCGCCSEYLCDEEVYSSLEKLTEEHEHNWDYYGWYHIYKLIDGSWESIKD